MSVYIGIRRYFCLSAFALRRPWLQVSAKRHMPSIDWEHLFHELNIPILYSREASLQSKRASLMDLYRLIDCIWTYMDL